MKITDIDKNFEIVSTPSGETFEEYTIPDPRFSLSGVFFEESTNRFVRMPSAIADQVNQGVKGLNGHTAGGRLRFTTDAKKISLTVTYDNLTVFPHMPLSGSGGFALLEETERGYYHRAAFIPPVWSGGDKGSAHGFSVVKDIPGEGMRKFVLFFPSYNDVRSLKIGFPAGTKVEASAPLRPEVRPILYYGSSITQGGCSTRPDNAYQSYIYKWNGIDFINLGFSGSARAEKTIVDYLASLDPSVFVVDYDHNSPGADYLRQTHYPLYKTFRDANPDTPIILISAPDNDGETPMWLERAAVVKATYDRAVAEGDKNVCFIDGKDLFEGADRGSCTVDRTHPNDLGFWLFAKKVYAKLVEIDPVFR